MNRSADRLASHECVFRGARISSLPTNGVWSSPKNAFVGGYESADLALKSSRIVDFGDKSSVFADLKNTVDRGSAESFGPVSGFCQSSQQERVVKLVEHVR